MLASGRVAEVPHSVRQQPGLIGDLCARATEPLVLRGSVADWPALAWRLDRICEYWPRRAVVARANAPGGAEAGCSNMSPKDFARLVTPDPPRPGVTWYFDMSLDLPELLADMPPPRVHSTSKAYLLIGRDTGADAHYHPLQHALICQVHGRKRVVLYPPADSRLLYPHSITGSDFNLSQADLRAPDLKRFPTIAAAHPIETTLEPGDALFTPVHWWHAIEGIGTTISVSVFWKARLRELPFPQPGLRTLAAVALDRLRGLRSAQRI